MATKDSEVMDGHTKALRWRAYGIDFFIPATSSVIDVLPVPLPPFDLHADVVVPPRDRARLERLCRYALRSPIAQERLHVTPEGKVILNLRHRWADGTMCARRRPIEARGTGSNPKLRCVNVARSQDCSIRATCLSSRYSYPVRA